MSLVSELCRCWNIDRITRSEKESRDTAIRLNEFWRGLVDPDRLISAAKRSLQGLLSELDENNPRLQVTWQAPDGAEHGQHFEDIPFDDWLVIGRSVSTDIRLTSPKVSSRHAMLGLHPEKGLVIRDLNSRNGTYINSHRIPSNTLQPVTMNDRVQIGGTAFSFRWRENRKSVNPVEIIVGRPIFKHVQASFFQEADGSGMLVMMFRKQGYIFLQLPLSMLTSMSARALGCSGEQQNRLQLPGPLEKAVIRMLIGIWLRRLVREMDWPPSDLELSALMFHWDEHTEVFQQFTDFIRVPVSLLLGEQRRTVSLMIPVFISDEFLNDGSNHFPGAVDTSIAKRIENISVQVPVYLATCHLPWSILKDMCAGDVILLPEASCRFDPGAGEITGTAWLAPDTASSIRLEARIRSVREGGGLLILKTGEEEGGLQQMSERPEVKVDGKNSDGAVNSGNDDQKRVNQVLTEQLQVPVIVELGRLKLPLREVIRLMPGKILEFPSSVDGRVVLRVGGQKIADGKLVFVDETPGVQIERIIGETR